MNILKRSTLACLLFLLGGSLQCQKLLWPQWNRFHGRFFEYTLPDKGNSTVTCFYQDKKGFLWLGTYSRLYRFDGTDYKRIGFTTQNEKGFDGKMITGMCEDSSGNLWIATTCGLNCYNHRTNSFKHFLPDSTDLMSDDNNIFHLQQDRKGIFWLITGGDIFSFTSKKGIFQRFGIDSLSKIGRVRPFNRELNKIFHDSHGKTWFATRHGLYMYEGKGNTLKAFFNDKENPSSISQNNISCIKEDSAHNIWIGTIGGGLNRLKDPDKGIFEQFRMEVSPEFSEKYDTINGLLTDIDGSLWIFGNEIFGCLSYQTGKFNSYLIPPGKNFGLSKIRGYEHIHFSEAYQFNEDEIWFLHRQGLLFRFLKKSEDIILYGVPEWMTFHCIMDKTGSFWLSSPGDKFWRLVFKGIPYTLINISKINTDNLNNQQSPKITEDRDNLIWFSLTNGIYNAENRDVVSDFSLKKFSFPDGDSIAECIMTDHEGNIWMSRSNGMIIRKSGSDNIYKIYRKPYGSTSQIYDIKEDLHGNIWLIDGTMIYWIPFSSDRIEKYNFDNNKINDLIKSGIWDFLVDRNDQFWLATFDKGVYVYDLKRKILNHYPAVTGMNIQTGDICFRIKEDKKGNIWLLFGTNGLYLFDPENKYLTNMDLGVNNPPGTSYLDMITEQTGKLFITTNNGVCIYDPETHRVSDISIDLSIINREVRCHSYQLSSGEILLTNGPELLLFPFPVPFNDEIPDIYITSLLVNNVDYNKLFPEADEINSIKKIYLSHSQNNLRIEFAALNFIDSKHNMYRFFMKGIDDDTIMSTSSYKFTEYKKMPPGNYTFWITGSNNDKVWNQPGKKIDIIIHSPWYKSIIAYLVYSIIFISLVFLFVRWRTYSLKTEKIKLEDEVAHRTAELENKTRMIEEMDNLKTRFFTSISHEFRTPLSLILGPIDNLLNENPGTDEKRRMKWIEIIRRNAIRLVNLVNQLLDISKVDAGKMKLILAESDIIKNLRMLIYEFLSLAESRKIRFIIQIPEEPCITIYDSDKIEKIVSNLLSNAFKFTPAYGTVICHIEIRDSEGSSLPQNIIIIVKDSGIGISKEKMDKIFDRFYRVEGQWEKDGNGTGIGLSLVEEFIKLLHGSIEVSSEPEEGSTFKVQIPLGKEHLDKQEYVLVDQPAEKMHLQDPLTDHPFDIVEQQTEISDKQVHILIVEDNIDLRAFISENLSLEYSIYEADDGTSGLSIAFMKIPDLIITDLIMPGTDGIELCKMIKNDERTSHIPVIMLTAKTTMEEKIEGLVSGADDYILKPFDINELKVRISNLLVQREKLRLKYGMLTGYEQPDKTHASIDEKFMTRIIRIINEYISDFDFDVGILQEKIGMSRVHLYRKLKAITGLSPSMIIRNCRMKKAAALINEKAGNLTEISLSVGFSNPAYFSKCFKDFFGVSPRDFTIKDHEKSKPEGTLDSSS